jgi:hypothetical protein
MVAGREIEFFVTTFFLESLLNHQWQNMKKQFFAGLLFFAAACSSGESSNTAAESDTAKQGPGNSAGSEIIGMDTARMDTGTGSISTDKIK